MKRNLLLVVLAAALLAGAQPAWGDFYVIAVPAGLGTPITSLPYTITQRGGLRQAMGRLENKNLNLLTEPTQREAMAG